ncbi:MAG: hypothetical protein ACR65W_14455 [Methylocystis sp.]|uniref:hypothetical protein n=1 Tax=Methylocystis sp. TaxID=1911079 RepID=UPI003DA3B880
MSELIAVAELKEITLRVEHKLDLLLSGRSALSAQADVQSTPINEGPKGWTKDEIMKWVNGLDGLTRANIVSGAADPQEVWESMKQEKGW